jgi:hypothetical protein
MIKVINQKTLKNTEEEVDEDEKCPCILHSEVDKAIKEMSDKKAAGDGDVPGDVLKLLGEVGLKIVINNIYDSSEWFKDFIEITVIALKKK